MAWNVICTPKQPGELGVLMNLALRCRWCWLDMAIVGKPMTGLPMEIPREAEGLFLAGARCILGDGRSLKFWQD